MNQGICFDDAGFEERTKNMSLFNLLGGAVHARCINLSTPTPKTAFLSLLGDK